MRIKWDLFPDHYDSMICFKVLISANGLRRAHAYLSAEQVSSWLCLILACTWVVHSEGFSPVVGHGQRYLKLGQELEVLLLRLLGEARPHQQHAQVLGQDHAVGGHGARALQADDALQALGQPHRVQEVELAQAVRGVGEVQQGARFNQEADGCGEEMEHVTDIVGMSTFQPHSSHTSV